jgi:hypothetical protein
MFLAQENEILGAVQIFDGLGRIVSRTVVIQSIYMRDIDADPPPLVNPAHYPSFAGRLIAVTSTEQK